MFYKCLLILIFVFGTYEGNFIRGKKKSFNLNLNKRFIDLFDIFGYLYRFFFIRDC